MTIGSTISRYKILEKLGEGGMGVVYKAEDTKLERSVALKFLAAHLLDDDEAKQRFLREAKAAAALSHPNICTVHEIDEAEGKTFLAMAYLKGETLEDRIAQGPLPLKDALDIARQVAEGLQAAHAEGIIHRDIKPANILVSPEGRATIMDFGLARLTEASRLTKAEQTVGTAAYMSPEQMQGIEVDHRTDVWAMGCVLYEMVAGARPFKGEYAQALAYEIVNQAPEPLTGIRGGVPMELEFVVGKCLARDREDRHQSAKEIAVDLRTLAEKLKSGRSTIPRTTNLTPGVPAAVTAGEIVNPVEPLPPGAVVVQRKSQRALRTLAAATTLAMLGLSAILFTQAPPETTERTITRFSFAPEGLRVTTFSSAAGISPDGKYILFVAETDGESSLWLRSLSNESAREAPGTEGAIGGFWSPDSSAIGFAVGGPDFELKRVAIDGGSPITLCELPDAGLWAFVGGTWSPDGDRIVFSSGHRLYEIAARGGQPQLLFDPGAGDGAFSPFIYPHFLPTGGGPAALVFATASSLYDSRVEVLNLETGERRELGPGSRPFYSLDGYLIHGPSGLTTSERGLWAWPFSVETLEPTGDAFPISTAGRFGGVSRGGTLAYLDDAGGARSGTLVWRDRAGVVLETIGQPQPNMRNAALSPDGQRIAVTSDESGNLDIWIHDLIRSTKTRLTFEDVTEMQPAWSPSGRELVYRQFGGQRQSLMRTAADGAGEAVVLVESEDLLRPDWSREGRHLVYEEADPDTGSDIRYLEFDSDGNASEPVTFLSTPSSERAPRLSPDARFLAYLSNESGRNEIYVRPFPSGAGKWQASVNGGTGPRWSPVGNELYYAESATLMSVSFSTEQGITLGQPQVLFETPDLGVGHAATYDVSADGQRFLTVAPVDGADAAPPKIRVVQNWYEEFRDREQD